MNVVPSPAEIAAFWASVARNYTFPNEEDRFGLPIVGPSLLSPASQWQEVTAKCEFLAQDVVGAIEGLLGMSEAGRIFDEVLRALKGPQTGRAPNSSRNDELLAEYDFEVAKNPAKKRAAARRVAKRRHQDPLDQEHLARHIRRLVANRTAAQQAQQEFDAFLKSFPPSLLQEATDIKGN